MAFIIMMVVIKIIIIIIIIILIMMMIISSRICSHPQRRYRPIYRNISGASLLYNSL